MSDKLQSHFYPLKGGPAHMVPKRVLIVDDSEVVRAAMRNFFEKQTDWQVGDEAADGTEAIQKATKLKPDLILLDFSMPNMNGIEAASVLRKKLPNTHIIVFTLYDDALGSRVSAAVGVDLIVSKAEGLTNLVKTVHQIVETLH